MACLSGCGESSPSEPLYQAEMSLGTLSSASVPLDRELRQVVARVNWVGCNTRPRDAVGGGHTPVTICAAEYAPRVGGPTAPKTGIAVARLVNNGTVVESALGLIPGVQYLTFVYPSTTSWGRAVTFAVRDTESEVSQVVADGDFTPCDHPRSNAAASADFRSCAGTAVGHRQGLARLFGFLPLVKTAYADWHRDCWISCTAGCCVYGCGGT